MDGSFCLWRNGSPFVQLVPETMLTFWPDTCALVGALVIAAQIVAIRTTIPRRKDVLLLLELHRRASKPWPVDARMVASDAFMNGTIAIRGQRIALHSSNVPGH